MALRRGVEKLRAADFEVLRVSGVYETEPVDLKEQPDFLNLVVEADTTLFPISLLQRVARIEKEMGRKRQVAKGPRTIDIDILLYGSVVMETPFLQIPHPRMTGRRFVLEPLAELAPDLRHPVTHKTVRELLASAPRQVVRKIDP